MREGNRTFIREGDRTIVREDDRTIIRHNEVDPLRHRRAQRRTERRGANSETIIERGERHAHRQHHRRRRPAGAALRRDANGRDIVIIDNSFARPRGAASLFIQLAPPVIRIPRERYILDAGRAGPEDIYERVRWSRRSS